MKPKQSLLASLLVGAALSIPLHTSAATIAHVDQFRVGFGSLTSPGVQFSDAFSDGIPPPMGPVTVNPAPPALPYPEQFGLPVPIGAAGDPAPSIYAVNVSSAGLPLLEANDRLYLDSSKGNPNVNALGQPRVVSNITLLTNNQMSNCAQGLGCTTGLRQSSSFVASALLELTPLNAAHDYQALLLGDRRPNPNNPQATIGGNVQFGPAYDPDGQIYLTLIAQQFSSGTRQVVRKELVAPPAGADGITLVFEHIVGSNDVFAYYRYYDDLRASGGALVGMGPLTYFATANDALFKDGADWTRAGVSVTQAVPEPGTWATMFVGMCLVSLRLWHRKQKAAALIL
jgi:hypothetical protein